VEPAVFADAASIIGPMRPYEEKILLSNREGRVLKRSDIYGSGPPSETLGTDTQKLVRQYCKGSILDLGAGCGALAQYLPREAQYLGIELDPVAVERARRNGRHVIAGDIRSTGLENASFQVCTLFEVLEHTDDYEGVLEEAHRLCSSHLVLTVPNIGVLPAISKFQVVPWHMLEATHVNFFTAETLQKLLSRFFPKVNVWEIYPWRQAPILWRLLSNAGKLRMHLAAVAWK
jgi:2-polyprenyl-3-methyl-5-hydroxy-6-metoxy-1,4-benzoquinol methylase